MSSLPNQILKLVQTLKKQPQWLLIKLSQCILEHLLKSKTGTKTNLNAHLSSTIILSQNSSCFPSTFSQLSGTQILFVESLRAHSRCSILLSIVTSWRTNYEETIQLRSDWSMLRILQINTKMIIINGLNMLHEYKGHERWGRDHEEVITVYHWSFDLDLSQRRNLLRGSCREI